MTDIASQILSLICAILVSWRVISVLNSLSVQDRDQGYFRWLVFGLSYSMLMMAAIASTVHVWQGVSGAVDWLWLAAAAGIVVFDRRWHRTLFHDRSHRIL